MHIQEFLEFLEDPLDPLHPLRLHLQEFLVVLMDQSDLLVREDLVQDMEMQKIGVLKYTCPSWTSLTKFNNEIYSI
jgi:hypothetical protein